MILEKQAFTFLFAGSDIRTNFFQFDCLQKRFITSTPTKSAFALTNNSQRQLLRVNPIVRTFYFNRELLFCFPSVTMLPRLHMRMA